jgi:hypothetical protein
MEAKHDEPVNVADAIDASKKPFVSAPVLLRAKEKLDAAEPESVPV